MSRVLIRATGLAIPFALAGSLLAAQTSATIYNDGRVLVRRTISRQVPRGPSTTQVTLGQIDPGTLFSLDSTVVITSSRYDAAIEESSVLRRAVGQVIAFVSGKDTIRVTVLSVDPPRYRMPDGSIAFSVPGIPLFPASLVVTDPTVTLGLNSSAQRDALRLGYFAPGASWQANYEVILRRGSALVQGDATINVDRMSLEEAELQLLAGSVSSAPKLYQPEPRQMMMARAEADQAPGEQQVGEFHLYTLPGRHSLLPGTVSSIALFDPARAQYERVLVVPGALPWYGILPQFPDPQEIPVEVSYTVKRPRGTSLGDRPLPGGIARLYEPDSSGRLQLIGEASLGHTPAGEDLRLSAGIAFDVTARRVQASYTTRRDSLVTWATADYAVTLTNAKDSAVTVEVLEKRPGEWSVVSSSVPAEKLSATTTRFRVTVPARGATVLTYRVRVKW